MDPREGDGDRREGDGPAGAVRTPERPDRNGPERPRPSATPGEEDREHGDAETYAVLGED